MTTTTVKYAFISLPLPSSQMVRVDALFRAVAEAIAQNDRVEQCAMLGRLVATLERAGVAVPEVWRCSLEEMAADG